MDQSNDTILERVRVREVAGIFRSRDALDATVDALLESGFDRADIALSSRHAARQELGIDIPAEEIPEVPAVPRRPFFGPEDVTLLIGMGIGILMFAGAALGAFAVVASGGSSAAAALAAFVGGTIVGSVGAARDRDRQAAGGCSAEFASRRSLARRGAFRASLEFLAALLSRPVRL